MTAENTRAKGLGPQTVGIAAFLLFAVAIGIAVYLAEKDKGEPLTGRYRSSGATESPALGAAGVLEDGGGLPVLVCLGAGECEPCRMMEPIREDLASNYSSRFKLIYYDVTKDAASGQKYGVQSIPLLVWLSPDGRELKRKIGFMEKADILKAWKVLGYDMGE